MNAAYVTVTAVTIALLVLISIPDYIPATFVLKTSSEVRVPRAWLPWLATLKLAGAGGLSVGLAGNFVEQPTLSAASTVIATCAGVGLVMFFCGAVIFHVRAHVFYNIWFPATYLLLCLTSLIFVLAH